VIDPKIPGDWPGFKATRKFRGSTYRITVEGTGAVNEAYVNGLPLGLASRGPVVIPEAAAGSVVEVRLLCGVASDQVAQ
jgi:cellobiose phosphorylase